MENYKTHIYDPVTCEPKGPIDTEIPIILVEAIRNALNNLLTDELEDGGWVVTPTMTNPNLNEISFGLLTDKPPSVFKYIVSIKTKEYWDDIYARLKIVKTEKD